MAREHLIPIRDSEHARELAAKSAAVRRKKSDERKEREARKFLLSREELSLAEQSTLVASSILDGLLVGDIAVTSGREAAQVLTAVYAIGRAEEERTDKPMTREEMFAAVRAIRDQHAANKGPAPA